MSPDYEVFSFWRTGKPNIFRSVHDCEEQCPRFSPAENGRVNCIEIGKYPDLEAAVEESDRPSTYYEYPDSAICYYYKPNSNVRSDCSCGEYCGEKSVNAPRIPEGIKHIFTNEKLCHGFCRMKSNSLCYNTEYNGWICNCFKPFK